MIAIAEWTTISTCMTSPDRYDQTPVSVPFSKLAEIYRVTPQALRKAGRKLLLRPCFMENPEALRCAMIEDNYSRGKLRRIVFDEAECARIDAEVDILRYPQTYES